ncbi:MAG TPA: BTAD domain-containing putative transcriptional regulator [Actinomycetota bacterium]|nr:BTAD domain-containing putative transcriptional regulator [Actinomycetota bacterium]
MEFLLLGNVGAVRAGREVDLGGPGQGRLLALLVLHAGEVVDAGRIADTLWGDDPPPGATTALHARVSRLRRALEPGLLVTRAPGYVLATPPESIDLHRFERMVREGRAHLLAGRAGEATEHLERALSLWRGPAFGSFAEEAFCQAAASAAEELRRIAAEDLLEARLALGLHAEVAGQAAALAEAEPLRERRWSLLMLALYRSGRQAEALAAYQRLRHELAEELGISPGPDLQQLEAAILRQSPELDWQGRTGTALGRASGRDEARSSAELPAPAGPAPESVPFVGRAVELAMLEGALRDALGGDSRVVVISGEPGIGKTRLAEELSSRATPQGAVVVWGRCYEAGAAPPLWPWSQVLSALAAGGDDPNLAALATEPALGGIEAETIPEAARLQMFTRLADALAEAAWRRPLAIVLDDLQWADTASLLFLQFLASHVTGAPLLVIGTHRDVGIDARHPLVGALARLAPLRSTRRIPLGGLAVDDVAAFLDATAPSVGTEVPGVVHRRTAGNPFFVREVVRLIAADQPADGVGTTGDGAVNAIPCGVRDVVRGRLALLGDAVRQVLDIGAVVGRDFDLDLVSEVSALDEDTVVTSTEVALDAGLLREGPAGAGTYRFAHDIVRETVYNELRTIRRRRMHRRIAEALESRRALPGAPHGAVAELAHHFHLAAEGGGPVEAAVRYAVEAADQATAALAYEDAVAHLQRAVELAGRRTAAAERSGAGPLLLRLGEAHWRAGEVGKARGVFLRAAELAREVGETELLARAVLGYGGGLLRAWHATRDMHLRDRMVELLEEALAGLGDEAGDLRVRLLGRLAEEMYYLHSERRISLSGEAVALARDLGDPRTLALALCSRCLAIWDPDHLGERLAVTAEILELAGQLGDHELEIFGRQHLFVAEMEAGDIVRADATLDRFEAAAERLRQPLYLWEARRFRALQALFTGRFADAERLAFEALEIGQRAEEPDALGVFGTQYGTVRLEQGHPEEIIPALRGLAAEFPDTPTWSAALSFLAARSGNDDEARELFDRLMVNGFADQPRNFAWLSGVVMLTEVATHLGDTARCRDLYALLAPFADHSVLAADRNSWGAAPLYLGMLAATLGQDARAEEHYRHALARNEAMGATPWVAHTCHRYAELLERRADPGDLELAAELAGRARAIATECGMSHLMAQLAALDRTAAR